MNDQVFDPEKLASYEPLAALLRERGLNAAVDDGGHLNYGVRIILDNPVLQDVFAACAEGTWGFDVTGRDGYLADSEMLELSADAPLDQVAAELERAILGLNAVD